MKTGLTLGKFAPLHKGHQALIEKGISETDSFVVVIYDSPNETIVPLGVRADWIKKLYPSVEVIEAWDGPTEVGDTPEIREMHEDYLRSILGDKRITNFYSSEFYGSHVSKALGAHDCRFDPNRSLVSTSGTAIRRDPFSNRQYVDQIVYRDLVSWIVFLGAPSTGKTTICNTMADLFGTVAMPEYGREYWEENHVDRRLTQTQLLEIAVEHRRREESLVAEANNFLFVDTNASTTKIFSEYYHGDVLPELDELSSEARSRYDLVFLCDEEIPYEDTWDRSGEGNRRVFQKKIVEELRKTRTPYVSLRGSLEERAETVTEVLSVFEKWNSLPDLLVASLRT